MSHECQIDVRLNPGIESDQPASDEIALIHAVLPELLKLMHELDHHEEAA